MSDQSDRLVELHRATRIPPPELVQQIDKGAFTADAVGHADITDILLTHDPLWEWEPFARDESGLPRITIDSKGRLAMWGWLTIHGHRRLEVGTCMATSPDPLKELVGDFLRRGAMRFGVALSLWSKSEWKEVSASTGGSRAGAGPSSDQRTGEENDPGPANVTPLPKPTEEDISRHPANGPTLPPDQAIAARAQALGLTDEERQEVISNVTAGRTTSGKDVRPREAALIMKALEVTAKVKRRG